VFRRRRAVTVFAVAAIALAAPAATATLRQSLAGSGGGALTTAGSAGAAEMRPASARVHIVQPGETLWSIAQADDPTGDPRPVVDRLARQVGGRPLRVGQRLVLP
jgi:Tfp pilus assembly protein FimV